MRVLAIGNFYPPAAKGGYERIFEAVVDALVLREHEVRILTTRPVRGADVPDEVLVAERAAAGPVTIHRELRWWWEDEEFPPYGLRDVMDTMREDVAILDSHLDWRPDVVCWMGMGGMPIALIEHVRLAGVPAAGYVADPWMDYGVQVDRWLRLCARGGPLGRVLARRTGAPPDADLGAAGRWLFISEWTRQASLNAGHELPETGVVRFGVDTDHFQERPAEPFSWRLACIGRVEPRKGVEVAIEALAQLPDHATLAMVGDAQPAYRAELERLADSHGVAGRVEFSVLGTGDVADAYAASDVLLFPVTWAEPWGLVPLESMAVGRPVIATGTGGSAEYLEEERNCLLVAPGDAASLAAAIRRLGEDGELRERLRAGGLETAARFTQRASTDAIVAALVQAV